MASTTSPEVYDLLILVDATYSMSSYISSLHTSLPQIIQISAITDCFSRIGLLAYRDYCCGDNLLTWSGWIAPSEVDDVSESGLMTTAKSLTMGPGGDWPEASKTGFARAYELMRKDATTIIIHYADAPPHTLMNGEIGLRNSYLGPELDALKAKGSYGGYGQHFADLVSASRWLSGVYGEKKAQVFPVLACDMQPNDSDYYTYLAASTGGACLILEDTKTTTISQVTVEILMSWMGAQKAGTSGSAHIPARMARYSSLEGIATLNDENDPAADKFFFATKRSAVMHYEQTPNVEKLYISAEVLKEYLPKKETPVQDFAKRYVTDANYRKVAMSHMKKIIDTDVVAISLNPVFGSLWRAVCNDRENEERESVVAAFASQIDRLQNPEAKSQMKTWLEESYDFTADVMEAIESVPEAERFPCVFLDPTQVFTQKADEEEDEANKSITSFTRDELLEIGRSCDYRILRRLGRVLTRLTYVKTAAELPAHIAAVPVKDIPRIPMALAQAKYKRKFWRILLHIVVPGTMLGTRGAALLAALSIRLGIEPLLDAADQEIILWRDRWNNIEVPETWNVSCLTLLMDADKAYRDRTTGKDSKDNTPLKPEDRELFDKLVSYRMLETNLTTTLAARVGWSPGKAKVAMGPAVTCTSCNFPRSVTVMGPGAKCGLCLWNEAVAADQNAEKADIAVAVGKDDDETTLATWLECNLATCKAHYVVYDVGKLNVKPKCHYCRAGKKAPVLRCSTCRNCVIYPEEYRDISTEDFRCYACISGRKTIVNCETTAKELSLENAKDWLLRVSDNKVAETMKSGRSLFHLVSTVGTEVFRNSVELFPLVATEVNLTLDGKCIHNVPDLIKELQGWVSRRQTEQGTCSLCFSSGRKDSLHLACGRTGCDQRVCTDCLKGWYGLNGEGRIINTAALSCPFCRRVPAPKTIVKYGAGIRAVAGLKKAVEERGEWIHAWCSQCGSAKQHMERVCAAGAPAELSNWKCDQCTVDTPLNSCPGCGVTTVKTGGCDHITCPCGTHWCWYCGKKCDENTIYTHLQEEHGGYYGGMDVMDAMDDEDEDEDYDM